jgi:hypothetical protein
MHALVRFAQIPPASTFSTGEIYPHVIAALSCTAEQYSLASLRYDRIVNLSGRGMRVVSVARQLGSGNSFARVSYCPAQPSGAGERRFGSVKLTMPRDGFPPRSTVYNTSEENRRLQREGSGGCVRCCFSRVG